MKEILMIMINVVFVVAIFVCGLIDILVTNSFSWSIYPISSIVYLWIILIPIMRNQKKKYFMSMFLMSVFITPYLYIISVNSGTSEWFWRMGIPIVSVALLYIWSVWLAFKKMSNRYYSATIAVGLIAPLDVSIEFFIRQAPISIIDHWDILIIICSMMGASIFLIKGISKKQQF